MAEVGIFNAETNENLVMQIADEEIEAYRNIVDEELEAKRLSEQAEAATKRAAAEAKLAALGLTTDDLKALGLG